MGQKIKAGDSIIARATSKDCQWAHVGITAKVRSISSTGVASIEFTDGIGGVCCWPDLQVPDMHGVYWEKI